MLIREFAYSQTSFSIIFQRKKQIPSNKKAPVIRRFSYCFVFFFREGNLILLIDSRPILNKSK